ncbi:hypothetical protein [Pseudoalteromonas aurantia]|uniref:Uncharacterized protein n=1 Tax=Pseudoalteromonas aurantia TaxID=43654 RepID=A0ABY2VRW5_9GAMM|nr:hypothetical protein [Pseudoalteromonas aurantia]TMO68854.1 hypothetical protein CWC20_21140 [Pseudoalteromonas aurantia]
MGLFSILFGSDESVFNSEPSINIDGSPMCGSVDLNGNPYGVTSTDDGIEHTSCFDIDFASSDTFDTSLA